MRKKLTKEEIKNYKMTEREIYEKFYNLSEDELNTENNKSMFVKNSVMTNIIEHCRGEKKKEIRAIDGFGKKLMIPEPEISVCPEHEVKSKIGTIFTNKKTLGKKSVKIYEIDPYFCIIKKKYKLMKMVANTCYLELIFSLLNIFSQ